MLIRPGIVDEYFLHENEPLEILNVKGRISVSYKIRLLDVHMHDKAGRFCICKAVIAVGKGAVSYEDVFHISDGVEEERR